MPDQRDGQRDQVRRHLERQYAIDIITAQYAEEVRGGRQPRIEEYIRRYPQYADELAAFAVYFETVGISSEALDGPADAALSPAAEHTLARIREGSPSYGTPPGPTHGTLAGLVARGLEVGLEPLQLAAAVGLSMDLLGKLEVRVIAVATIPPTLVKRFAAALRVAPDAVAAYLGAAGPGTSGAFFYADQPPTHQQESFLDAVRGSALQADVKRDWEEIVRADAGGRA
jgi:hypothetical protein